MKKRGKTRSVHRIGDRSPGEHGAGIADSGEEPEKAPCKPREETGRQKGQTGPKEPKKRAINTTRGSLAPERISDRVIALGWNYL